MESLHSKAEVTSGSSTLTLLTFCGVTCSTDPRKTQIRGVHEQRKRRVVEYSNFKIPLWGVSGRKNCYRTFFWTLPDYFVTLQHLNKLKSCKFEFRISQNYFETENFAVGVCMISGRELEIIQSEFSPSELAP